MSKIGQSEHSRWVMDMAAGVATAQSAAYESQAVGSGLWNEAGRVVVLSCGTRIEWLSLPAAAEVPHPT